jgi:PIN domain nuclease of toxin-antitoxin system
MAGIVLDSSAIIAVLKKEVGAERVLLVSDGAPVSTLIVAEVASWLVVHDIDENEIHRVIDDFNLVVHSFHQPQAIATGLLIAKARRRGLSLADRACLILAMELGMPVLTGDRAWRDLDIGVEVQLFR